MKSKEELEAIRKEVETVNKKLRELSKEELAEVTGGSYEGSYAGDENFGIGYVYTYPNDSSNPDAGKVTGDASFDGHEYPLGDRR